MGAAFSSPRQHGICAFAGLGTGPALIFLLDHRDRRTGNPRGIPAARID